MSNAKLNRLQSAGEAVAMADARAQLMLNLTHLYLTAIRSKPGAQSPDAALYATACALALELYASGQLTEVNHRVYGRVVRINAPGNPQHGEYLRYRGRGNLSRSTVLGIAAFHAAFGTKPAAHNKGARSLITPSDTLVKNLQHNVQYLNGATADRFHYQTPLTSDAPGTRPLDTYKLPELPADFPDAALMAPRNIIKVVNAYARITDSERIHLTLDAYVSRAVSDWQRLSAPAFLAAYTAHQPESDEGASAELDAAESVADWNPHNTLKGTGPAVCLPDLLEVPSHYVPPAPALCDNPIAPGFDLRLRAGVHDADPLLPRGAQAAAVWELLTRRDDLVISAGTGSGKTDIIIEGVRRTRGISVVVSMLAVTCTQIAEQMRKLTPGKAVARFGDGVCGEVRMQSLAALAVGKVDTVVLTWESLYPGSDIMLAIEASGRPVTFYVDEAHVAAPGADEKYRPACRVGADYIRDYYGQSRKILLSATLGGSRYAGLLARLGVVTPRIVAADLCRPNIQITTAQHTPEFAGAVLDAVNQIEGKRLVLCATKSQVIQVRDKLAAAGISTFIYYGTTSAGVIRGAGRQPAMTPKRKATELESFRTSKDGVMIATSAFGTGVDIPNIRGVILTYVPETLIDVCQMVGRAGRDNQPARAVCLHNVDAVLHATNNQSSDLLWEFYRSASRPRWDVLADALAVPVFI